MEEVSIEKSDSDTSKIRMQKNKNQSLTFDTSQGYSLNNDNSERLDSNPSYSSENESSENNQKSFVTSLNRTFWTPISTKFQGRRSSTVQYYFMLVITNITLEPAEFLWSLGGNMATASFSQLLVDKACNDRGYNETICDDVYYYEDIYKEVSKDVNIKFLRF